MKPISRMTSASSGEETIFWCGRPRFLSCSWRISRPACSVSSRDAALNHWLILFFARVVWTTASQSRDGPRSRFEVRTSTMSPDFSS